MTCNNNIIIFTVFGVIYGFIHFLEKEQKKKHHEMLIMQRKIENLTHLCKEMKEEIRKMQEEENTAKRFISLSDLAHRSMPSSFCQLEDNGGLQKPYDDGIEYEECIEQFIEQCSEHCAEQFIDIKDSKDMQESDTGSQRNRSNSLSSILGTAKKMVFG